jgi:succinyl-CoA synthetase beta subunit
MKGTALGEFVKLCGKLYELFVKEDCSLLEINPLSSSRATTTWLPRREGELRRQRELPPPRVGRAPRRERGGAHVELEAKEAGLSYVSLDGNIGCLVNGAGLAMARWTSSSTTAARPRTSSTSAAAPRRTR